MKKLQGKTKPVLKKKFQYEFWKPDEKKTIEGKLEGFFSGKYSPIMRIGYYYVNLNYDLQKKIGVIKDELEVGVSKIRITYTGKKDVGQLNKMSTFDVLFNGKKIEVSNGFEPIDTTDLPF